MAHDAKSVANEIIDRAFNADRQITHLQVQKLIYLCHGWMLGLYSQPMINQPVEAWKYGPVIPEVYDSLRRYGGFAIKRPIEVPPEEYSSEEKDVINQVWQVYGGYSGIALSAMTHAPGTPWRQTWDKYGDWSVIPETLIEDFYYEKANND